MTPDVRVLGLKSLSPATFASIVLPLEGDGVAIVGDGMFFNRLTIRFDFFMAAFRLARDGFVSEEYASNTDANFLRFLDQPDANKLWNAVVPPIQLVFRNT